MKKNNPENLVEKNNVIEISFVDFKKTIENFKPQNDPYTLKITGLTKEDLGPSTTSGTLGDTINKCNSKLDLGNTKIPDNLTNMEFTFAGCISLIEAPIISDSVKNMSGTFYGCTSLVKAPMIPDSVTKFSNSRCAGVRMQSSYLLFFINFR